MTNMDYPLANKLVLNLEKTTKIAELLILAKLSPPLIPRLALEIELGAILRRTRGSELQTGLGDERGSK